MVYFYTSGNVRMLRNIIMDFHASTEVSPYEYMKTYIQKCPETTEDVKLSWITESFLGIQKHKDFLTEIASHMPDELSEEDEDYCMIIFYAVTFKIEPKDMQLLYKCTFNLSKVLLNTFTTFLSNNEVLTFISQVAQKSYDANYITDKIIKPLFEWQPYISEMAHSYAEYVKKTESRKIKTPTIPIQPNVLNQRFNNKDNSFALPQPLLPESLPNIKRNKYKKMLTKNTIDQKLKQVHEKNKQKAARLLNDVKNNDFHHAQIKSDPQSRIITYNRDESETNIRPFSSQNKKTYIKNMTHKVTPSVKETATTVKRIHKRVQLAEKEEVQWLETLVNSCRNTTKVEELEEYNRQERERERLFDIEKKHLMGQITHEEALIAKKKLHNENKKRYEEFIKEKELWNQEIENWKKIETERNRKQVEKFSLNELNLLQAKNSMTAKKKITAEKLRKESEIILVKTMQEKQDEMERKVNMIREIKILAIIAKKAKLPKIIDLTESSGVGLLCEMSMAELQERISVMKIALKDELEMKRKLVKKDNENTKYELEEAKQSIKNYMSERAEMRKHSKKSNVTIENSSSKEISNLKKILDEKRKLRANLNK